MMTANDPSTSPSIMTDPSNPTPAAPQPQLLTAGTEGQAPPTVTAGTEGTQPAAGAAPQTQKPQSTGGWIDKILRGATGGEATYVDANGQQQKAPQSRATLGKTLIAATLAGLLAKDEYVQTPYGPRRDFAGSAGNAAAAAGGVIDAARARPQKISDEKQAKALMTLDNTSKMIQLRLAAATLGHQNYEMNKDFVSTAMSPIDTYEQDRTANNDPNQPAAWVDGGRGLDHEQALAMASKQGISQANIMQDAWVEKWDANANAMVPEPTYGILNPALKNLTLPKKVTDMLAEVNGQWKDIHSYTSGDPRVGINAYVSALRDYDAVIEGQGILNSLSEDLGGKSIAISQVKDAARAGRDNRAKNIFPALYGLVQASSTPNQHPENLLYGIINSPNGQEILKVLGMTPEEANKKADALHLKRVSDEELAKQGGMGPKAPADPEQVKTLVNSIDTNENLSDDDRKALHSDIPTPGQDGVVRMNQAQVDKVVGRFDTVTATNKNNAEKKLLANGDPDQMKKTATNTIEGDTNNIVKISSLRGNARANTINAIHDEAEARGLDTTKYSEQALETKANMYNEFYGDKKGSQGAMIQSFNAFLGHTANAVDSEKHLEGKTFGLKNTPIINTGMDVIGKQLENDPDWKAYKTSLIPVEQEISNFLSAGYAVKAEDSALMKQVLDPHETPARITAALRTLAETADVRLASMGQKYLDTMDSTYPNLLSSDSQNTLKRMGIKSKAIPLGEAMPRGWKNHQPTMLQPNSPLLPRLLQLTGNNPTKATALAKENGWTIPQ